MLSRTATLFMAVVFALLLLASFLAYPRVEASLISTAQTASKSTLRLVSGAVDQAIGQYDPIPTLIAGDPVFRELLRQTENEGIIPFVNEKLRHMAESVGASEIYVMDTSGVTIAASNYREVDSFVGKNFDFRPYFSRAIAGETAVFHALGITSGERGFFFAAPVLDGIEVLGVLAVKVKIDSFENSWEGASNGVLVADPNGVVFLSSRADYRMRSLAPLSSEVLARIEETRQFPLSAIQQIPFSANVIAPNAVKVALGDTDSQESYLADSQPLALSGWHSIVLTPLDPIRTQAIYVLVVWNLAAAALALAVLVLAQRRARILERIRVEKTQRGLLEKMVQERTSDLDEANVSLRAEVNERKTAEDRLRRTQKDLVQAGKLAALGKMSAAISHEINQPLAAVKSFADNAAQYLERSRFAEAGTNIEHISKMADRMAKISGHLRNFARQPRDTSRAIPVYDVIEAAIAIMDPQLRQSDATIEFSKTETELWVMGGQLRLQQVLINIISNAIDAMEGQDEKRVEVNVEPFAETIAIQLRDHGPGLNQPELDQAFEAFFTTKTANAGMGLGLSISYNIVQDFGGKLMAANHPDGGGLFTVKLRRASENEQQEQILVAE